MIDRNIFTVKKLTLGITFVLIFTALLSACGPAPTTAPAPTQPPTAAPQPVSEVVPATDLSGQLVGPLWMLLGYGDAGNPTIVEPGTNVTVQFAEDNSLNGFGGCNSFFGPYELTGDEIKIGPLGSTMMACEKGMTQEISRHVRPPAGVQNRLHPAGTPGDLLRFILIFRKETGLQPQSEIACRHPVGIGSLWRSCPAIDPRDGNAGHRPVLRGWHSERHGGLQQLHNILCCRRWTDGDPNACQHVESLYQGHGAGNHLPAGPDQCGKL